MSRRMPDLHSKDSVAANGPSRSEPNGQRVPTATDVKQHFSITNRERSTFKGSMLFAASFAGYCLSFATAVCSHNWLLCIFGSIGALVFTSTLFVIGHDACHGSLTRNARLNKFLGRLSFFPSYHPFSSWEHTHNGLHHGMTNVRGHDPVFVPLSKSEYDSLPWFGRVLQRIYRTTPGLGLYYFHSIWLTLELFPKQEFRPVGRRARTFQFDRLLIFSFFTFQLCLIGASTHAPHLFYIHSLMAIGIPFLLFNAAMGFVIFLHHTHPRVPWYKSGEQFSFFASQVRSSVHAEFPRLLELILHNIMDHTAHHADPRIPLYKLHDSQKSLENVYPIEITVEPWTFRGWQLTLRTCRLYDYERHQWVNYDGKPTSGPLLESTFRISEPVE